MSEKLTNLSKRDKESLKAPSDFSAIKNSASSSILIFSLWFLPKLKTVYGSNILGKTGVCFLGAALCIFAFKTQSIYYITPVLLNIAAILLFISLLDYLRFFLKIK